MQKEEKNAGPHLPLVFKRFGGCKPSRAKGCSICTMKVLFMAPPRDPSVDQNQDLLPMVNTPCLVMLQDSIQRLFSLLVGVFKGLGDLVKHLVQLRQKEDNPEPLLGHNGSKCDNQKKCVQANSSECLRYKAYRAVNLAELPNVCITG